MSFNYSIRTVDSTKDLKRLREFLITQSLGYPNYDQWVDCTCIPEIEKGTKTGIVAYSNGPLVGDAVFQQHKEFPQFRELKNIRIDPELRGKDLGHFIMRQIEEDDPDFKALICDAPADNISMLTFLHFCGFQRALTTNLYTTDQEDVVLVKQSRK